jgi:hypothetical protein
MRQNITTVESAGAKCTLANSNETISQNGIEWSREFALESCFRNVSQLLLERVLLGLERNDLKAAHVHWIGSIPGSKT